MAKKSQKTKDEELVEEALKRFDRSVEYEKSEREMALHDIRFVHDEDYQWTEQAKAAREGRPVMQFDKLSGSIDQVMGDHLQNRPAIKVRAVEDGDMDTAETYTGLIRNIESTSNAKRAYSNGFKFSISGGFGHWRIVQDYVSDDCFDQDLIIKAIPNPFNWYSDPLAEEVTKEDGMYWIGFKELLKADFEELYPKAQSGVGSDFSATGLKREWFTDEMVRIAEYYRKVPAKKKLYMMSDQSVLDSSAEPILDELAAGGIEVVNEREIDSHNIEHYLITGIEVLETYEYLGKYFPIIPVYGKSINIEGKFKYRGLVRKGVDAQRAYNYERSNYIEQTALQPKQPLLATQAMIDGHEQQWKNMNTTNDPVLLFNFDQGQAPTRQPPGQPNAAYLAAMQISSDDIKSTTSIYDASLGARSNETSGKAILERDRQGDTATFEYTSELVEAIEYTGKVLVDLIPKIYDGDRMIRILGEDDAEDSIHINQAVMDMQSGQEVIKNDLSKGTYDVVVRTGASYSTKRAETATQMSQIMAQNPEMSQLFADIYFKSLDLVGGEEVVKRIRKIGIQKGFIEMNDEEKKEAQENQNPEQEAMKKQVQQLKMKDAAADVALKEAKVMSENAKGKKDDSTAVLNTVKAQVEQLELAMAQGDMMQMQQILQRLLSTMMPQQMMPQQRIM